MIPTFSFDKHTGDDLVYAFEYSAWTFLASDALVSGTITIVGTPNDLNIGAVTVSGTQLRAEIKGGTNNSTYQLKTIATTTSGKTIEDFGYGRVKDDF